jgi:hypothetical protein
MEPNDSIPAGTSRRCFVILEPLSIVKRDTCSVTGWRSASYASRIDEEAQPASTAASSQDRFAASAIPAFIP